MYCAHLYSLHVCCALVDLDSSGPPVVCPTPGLTSSTPVVCVCVGGLEVGVVLACSWFALVTGVGGYVLAGVEIGVLSCVFLYFCGC